MSILCTIGGHEADSGEVYNCGYYFSRCKRCGDDMVRSGASWRLVPRGHRVVWKQGRHQHSIEASYARHLPTVHRDANLPAVRPSYVSWNRQLVRLAGAGIATNNEGAMAAVEERQDHQYPVLLALAAIVGAGLQLFLTFGQRPGG